MHVKWYFMDSRYLGCSQIIGGNLSCSESAEGVKSQKGTLEFEKHNLH